MNSTLTAYALTIVFATFAVGCATAPDTKPTQKSAAPPATTASAPVTQSAWKYTTSDTPIGELLDDPKARAVLEQNIPGLTTSSQIDMARGMTLKGIQPYAVDTITDAVLANIDAAFAALDAP
jgi:para-nitrobenzyl esterase